MSFTTIVLDHVSNPRNAGPLESATHKGMCGIPGEGPYVVLWLEIDSGAIIQAAYETYGCPAAIASASLVTQLLIGRTVNQARLIEPNDVTLLLGGLPEGKGHCPQMAIDALIDAIGALQQS